MKPPLKKQPAPPPKKQQQEAVVDLLSDSDEEAGEEAEEASSTDARASSQEQVLHPCTPLQTCIQPNTLNDGAIFEEAAHGLQGLLPGLTNSAASSCETPLNA